MSALIVSDNRQLKLLLLEATQKQSLTALVFDSISVAMNQFKQTSMSLPTQVFVSFSEDHACFGAFVNYLRNASKDRYLSIVGIVESTEDLNQCASMTDDVLVMPCSLGQLECKVKTHIQTVRKIRCLENERDQLSVYRENICLEQELVNKIFALQCESQLQDFDNLRCRVSAQAMFQGDFLLSQQGPSGNIYLLLGQASGSGLPGAMASIPLFSVFNAMSQKGLPVGSIAAELNRVLPKNIPDGNTMGATIIELNSAADQLTVWSGGMPAMVIADSTGDKKFKIVSDQPALAAIDEFEFCQDVATYCLAPDDQIVMVTKGLEEATNIEQNVFGSERFLSLFDGSQRSVFDAVTHAYDNFTEGEPQSRDFSLVELTCNAAAMPSLPARKKAAASIPWRLEVKLNAHDLKTVNPVPQIVKLLSNAVGLDVHQDYISTILSELFSNALEHGVLGLSSSMKESEDGFMEYYMQRESRLAELADGWVEIVINLHQAQVMISVHDSGPGFEYQARSAVGEENAFGRGTHIISTVCDSFEYSHNGSKVTVLYSV